MGAHPVRCRICKTRFVARIWDFTNWRFARCPNCYGFELTTWSEDHYSAVGMTAIKISLGARRYRCDQCRVNFASFRPRRKKGRKRRTAKRVLHVRESQMVDRGPEAAENTGTEE